MLNRRWLEEFGGLLGLRVSDLVGQEGIEPAHLIQYTYPTDDELAARRRHRHLPRLLPAVGRLAERAHRPGATASRRTRSTVEGSLVNYENLDNDQTGIHDYFKFLKYGFGRATDIACMHVRRGRLSPRRTRRRSCSCHDGKFPWTYLGKPLEEILDEIDMTLDEFVAVCDRFTNKRLFVTRPPRRAGARRATATSRRSTTTTCPS